MWRSVFAILVVVFMTLTGCTSLLTPSSQPSNVSTTPSTQSSSVQPETIESYLAKARDMSISVKLSLEEIGKVLAQYPDVSSYPDYVLDHIRSIKKVTSYFTSLIPPKGLEELDEKITSGAERFSWAMDYLTETTSDGSLDPNSIQRAITLLDGAKDYLANANFAPLPISGSLSLDIITMSSFVESEKSRYTSEKEKQKWVLTDAEIEEAIQVGKTISSVQAIGSFLEPYTLNTEGLLSTRVSVLTPFASIVVQVYYKNSLKPEYYSFDSMKKIALSYQLVFWVQYDTSAGEYSQQNSAVLILNDGTISKPTYSEIITNGNMFSFDTAQIRREQQITFILKWPLEGIENRAEIDLSKLK
jgi:hypothetical protein